MIHVISLTQDQELETIDWDPIPSNFTHNETQVFLVNRKKKSKSDYVVWIQYYDHSQ